MRALTLSVFLGLLSLITAPTNAQDITLNADEGNYFSEENRVELSGNVRVVRGEMQLLADRVVAFLTDGEPTKIEAVGNVKLNSGDHQATTEKLTYDVLSGRIQMGGKNAGSAAGTASGGVSFKLKAETLKDSN